MSFKCFKCGQEITFNAMQVGKTGKKIPLDPTTELPHECPMRDQQQQQTQTETSRQNEEKIKEANGNGGYVDHTLAQQSDLKLKTITDPTPEGMDLKYNNWAKEHKIKFSQYHPQGSLYTIAVWYEEIVKQQ